MHKEGMIPLTTTNYLLEIQEGSKCFWKPWIQKLLESEVAFQEGDVDVPHILIQPLRLESTQFL